MTPSNSTRDICSNNEWKVLSVLDKNIKYFFKLTIAFTEGFFANKEAQAMDVCSWKFSFSMQ